MPQSQTIAAARSLFPRGLVQPEHGFRFSRDALLLADFAAKLACGPAAADLGAGCGVIGLDLALQRPEMRVVGVEKDAGLALAARENAAALGLEQVEIVTGDLASPGVLRQARRLLTKAAKNRNDAPPPLFDLVLCNPPWRREGAGRTPPSPTRRAALFGNDATFSLFFGAADRLLAMHGALALVCGAERLADVLAALPPRLRPVRLRFVHARTGGDAVFFLLEARKGSRAALRVDPPLALAPGQAPRERAEAGLATPRSF